MSSNTPITKILILAANPKDTTKLCLDEEVREIAFGLQRSKQRNQFVIESRWGVRSDDLRRAILDFEPQIVHFCGHGETDGGLVLENVIGEPRLVNPAVAGLFELFTDQVECVVLNACYSDQQAEAIIQHIDYVIGTKQAIGGRDAIKFAIGFYDALGAGRSIEVAYKFGVNAIGIEGISEELTPIIKKKPQISSTGVNLSFLKDLPPVKNKLMSAPSTQAVKVVKQIIQRHNARLARAIAVLLRRVDYWKSRVANLKALPKAQRLVTKWRNYQHAFESIAQGIWEKVKELIGSRFPIKKYLRQIKAAVMPVANALVYVTSATITFFARRASYGRLIRAGLIQVAKPILIVASAIFLSPLLPDISGIFSSEPNRTLRSTRNITPIGWIRIGIVNNTSSSLSFVDRLLQTSDSRSAPSIDSPVVPSIGAVVTVKNPVNLRKNRPETRHRSNWPQKVGLLKPEEKLIILKVQRLVNTDFNSFRIEVWAQVGRCKGACDR